MKGLVRAAWFQSAAGWVTATWLRFCYATSRWRFENRAAVEAVWAAGGGVVICFWHEQISLSLMGWRYDGVAQEARALISRSHDGEIIAQAIERLGTPPIRGSSAKRGKGGGHKDKGGTEALRDILRWVRAGNAVAMTPDGPRGPARQLAEGAILTARMTKAHVVMFAVAARPVLRLGTWDRAIIPLPFARGVVVYGDSFVETGEDSETSRAEWKAKLDALTERAEALVA